MQSFHKLCFTYGGIGGWSTNGCWVDSTNDTSTTCKCNHFTNFALLMNVGNPKCVFWNFTANGGIGGWSTNGCWVDSTNDTSTTCKCNHFTNFALLMVSAFII
ncbi:uncharacterized protein [Antedon mediterranea]|uniref:uncharacterized protein isoform X3 n=1 Tax=Antedon mediterranea TaxID=105859 RepID=UPI003AF9EE27